MKIYSERRKWTITLSLPTLFLSLNPCAIPLCLRSTKLFPAARNSPGCDKRLGCGNDIIWRGANIADRANNYGNVVQRNVGVICPLLS